MASWAGGVRGKASRERCWQRPGNRVPLTFRGAEPGDYGRKSGLEREKVVKQWDRVFWNNELCMYVGKGERVTKSHVSGDLGRKKAHCARGEGQWQWGSTPSGRWKLLATSCKDCVPTEAGAAESAARAFPPRVT